LSPAISVENLSKRFRIGLKEKRPETLAGALFSILKAPIQNYHALRKLREFGEGNGSDIIWALKDISFELNKGEVLGIIGRNGAGKSTLLKVLSKITPPTSGKIEINGRVSALLEVGTGFHPDLTGRDNIYMNGTILGMRKVEIDRKFDEIVAFSGVEKFIDTPVKRYSSGMKLRLGFSVAAYLEPEVLIIDEVLAVGDADFQKKCLGRIGDVVREGRTVLFVSHNMGAIKNLCPQSMYLKDGKIALLGKSDEVVKTYLNENLTHFPTLTGEELQKRLEWDPGINPHTVNITTVAILDDSLHPRKEFHSDEEVIIKLDFEVFSQVKDIRIIIELLDDDNTQILATQISDTEDFIKEYTYIKPGFYSTQCTIPGNTLGNNEFFVSAHIIHPAAEHVQLIKGLSFNMIFKGYNNIQTGTFGSAMIRPKLEWKMENLDLRH